MDVECACASDEVEGWLAAEQERFLLAGAEPTRHEDDYQAMAPPVGLLRGRFSSVDEFRARVLDVPWRWRLDVILALGDHVG